METSATMVANNDWQIALVNGQKAIISLEIAIEDLTIYRKLTNALSKQLDFLGCNKASFDQLTRREKQVLHHILQGYSNETIADMLCLSCYTIKTHRKNINEKLGCKTMVELLPYLLFF